MLPAYKKQKIFNLIVPGQPSKTIPPETDNTIAAVLSHPKNKHYGILHCKDFHVIGMRLEVLERALIGKLFKAGDDYSQLIEALDTLGYEFVDIKVD